MKVVIVLGHNNKNIMKKRVDRALEEFASSPRHTISKKMNIVKYCTYILLTRGPLEEKGSEIGANIMEEYASKYIDTQYIWKETSSKNTVENLICSKVILDKIKTTPLDIVICTSSYHVKRAAILAKLILDKYSLSFIHTREQVTREEYNQESTLLNVSIDKYIGKHIVDNILITRK